LLPDPETIRSSLFNQSQVPAKDKPDDIEPVGLSRDGLNCSELAISQDQMEELGCEWKCRQCDFRNSCFAQVEGHVVEQHLQLKPYSCPHCHKYFSVSEAVLFHIDEDHSGRERHVVSTIDEKSNYIRRNIQCVSVDVEPSSSSNTSRPFQVDRAGSVPNDTLDGKSNSKDSGLEKVSTGVPRKSSDEELSNNVRSPRQAKPPQTGDASAGVKNSMTEERLPSSFSNNILSPGQEERHVTNDGVTPTLSCSSAEQEQAMNYEARGNDEGDVRELQLVTDKNSGGKQPDISNDSTNVPRTSQVDHIVTDAPTTSAEGQGALGDSPHGKNLTIPRDNPEVPSFASAITTNKEDSDDKSTQVDHVNSDALLVSAEEQEQLRDSSRTQQPSDAQVLSASTSNSVQNEGSKDVLPVLAEQQLLPSDFPPSVDHSQRFNDAPLFLTNLCISTDEGLGDSRMTSELEHKIADDSSTPTAERRSYNDTSASIEHTEQSTDIPAPSTTSDSSTDEENNEDWKNGRMKEITYPVSAENESVKPSPEERVQELSHSLPAPAEMEKETVRGATDGNHVENPQPSSNQIVGTDLCVVDIQKNRPALGDAGTETRDKLRYDHVTTALPEHVDLNGVTSQAVSKEQQTSTDSSSRPFSEADTEDCRRLNSNPANDNRPSSTGGETPSASQRDDDGLSSDSSSSEEETSTWRCDDCSFVATSETALVAHTRSRQQYRCLYCPDFHHSSVVHMRHHCLTRHPGKPISYKHSELPCSEIRSTTATSGNSGRDPASSGQSANAQTAAAQPKIAETPPDTAPVSKPENTEPDSPGTGQPDEEYSMDLEESSDEESDNSEDEDWDEYEPVKKKSKMSNKNKNISRSPKDADAWTTAGPQGTIVCDICNSYSTPNSTVMRHHVMSHLQYYPYFCPHCSVFRSVRSFPIIKHIRMKHAGMAERFECNPDPELENKVKKSSHRVKSNEKEPRTSASVEEIRDPPLPQPVETKAASSSQLEERRDQVVRSAPAVVASKTRRVLYKCKICGLRTHLRGDFRHHIMRELQYKPFK